MEKERIIKIRHNIEPFDSGVTLRIDVLAKNLTRGDAYWVTKVWKQYTTEDKAKRVYEKFCEDHNVDV